MSCINLKIKTKKRRKFLYCNLLKKEITFDNCKDCANKEYKKVKCTINRKNCAKKSTLNKKRINPISKKREFVSKETYNIVFNKCEGKCVICGSYNELHLHHIEGRGKGKTDNPNNCIILCRTCHLEKVHMNNKYWRKKLKEMIDNE